MSRQPTWFVAALVTVAHLSLAAAAPVLSPSLPATAPFATKLGAPTTVAMKTDDAAATAVPLPQPARLQQGQDRRHYWTTLHAADCIASSDLPNSTHNATVAQLKTLCEADAACVGFTTGTGVDYAVGIGTLKNSSCIDGLFSSASPTLYLLQNHSAADVGWPPIWPRPLSFKNHLGEHTVLDSLEIKTNVSSSGGAAAVPKRMQQQFQRFLSRHFGDWPAAAPTQHQPEPQAELAHRGNAATLEVRVGDPTKLFDCDESYSLEVPSDSAASSGKTVIVLTAATAAGVNWGLETLSQLMVLDRDTGGSRPQIVIRNTPIR